MDTEGFYTVSDLDGDLNVNRRWHILEVAEKASQQQLMSADLQVVDEWIRNYHAQCTRDLDSIQCNDCLENLIAQVASCCQGKRSWRYLAVSCSISYQAIIDSNDTDAIPPIKKNSTDALASAAQRIPVSPPSLAPPPKGEDDGSRQRTKRQRVWIISSFTASLGIFLLLSFRSDHNVLAAIGSLKCT
ncbi:hypothetical protein MRB53_021322 [Persea americana]|uniref:Uncharacterized protein n=1 Tax=Persea americana TaxID=3435 RepID=A0ACC2L3V6_PERAE|nr:hypothetical protein MRB53_021322 [Persea americana]